jgi:hypothetical protein
MRNCWDCAGGIDRWTDGYLQWGENLVADGFLGRLILFRFLFLRANWQLQALSRYHEAVDVAVRGQHDPADAGSLLSLVIMKGDGSPTGACKESLSETRTPLSLATKCIRSTYQFFDIPFRPPSMFSLCAYCTVACNSGIHTGTGMYRRISTRVLPCQIRAFDWSRGRKRALLSRSVLYVGMLRYDANERRAVNLALESRLDVSDRSCSVGQVRYL